MTLDDIRRSIAARRDAAMLESRVADQNLALAEAELEAHDRAVAAMGNGAAKPERAARRDIAALVRDALTDEPQTIAQLAEATQCFPSRVLPALKRIGARLDGGDGWVKP